MPASLTPPSGLEAMDGPRAQDYRLGSRLNDQRANREVNRWPGRMGRSRRSIESPAHRQVNQGVSVGTQRRHCHQWLRFLKQLEVVGLGGAVRGTWLVARRAVSGSRQRGASVAALAGGEFALKRRFGRAAGHLAQAHTRWQEQRPARQDQDGHTKHEVCPRITKIRQPDSILALHEIGCQARSMRSLRLTEGLTSPRIGVRSTRSSVIRSMRESCCIAALRVGLP